MKLSRVLAVAGSLSGLAMVIANTEARAAALFHWSMVLLTGSAVVASFWPDAHLPRKDRKP